MSDNDNVVSLPVGRQAADAAPAMQADEAMVHGSSGIVTMLEQMLQAAREGKYRFVAVATVCSDVHRSTVTTWSHNRHDGGGVAEGAGAVQFLLTRLSA